MNAGRKGEKEGVRKESLKAEEGRRDGRKEAGRQAGKIPSSLGVHKLIRETTGTSVLLLQNRLC